MSDMELRLAIRANNKGVSGTVRETAREVRGLEGSLSGTATAARTNTRQMTGLTTAGQEATRMFRLQKGSLQQAGYQFQDLAVQIGSGTSAFVAMGQQGSQLLSLLGPGGALLGAGLAIASVFGGVLYNALGDSSKRIDTLSDSVEGLSDKLTTAKDGTILLADELRELASVSRDAARIELIVDAQQAKSTAIEAANTVIETFKSIAGENPLLPDTIYSDRIGEISETLQITRQDAEALADALPRTTERSQEAYQELLGVVADLADQYGASSPQVLKLAESLGISSVTAIKALRAEESLKAALEDTNRTIDNSTGGDGGGGSYKDLVDAKEQATRQALELTNQLEFQGETVGKNARKIALYKAQLLEEKGAEPAIIQALLQQIDVTYDAIEAEEERQAGLKASAQAAKEWSRAQLSAEQGLSALMDRIDPLGAELRSLTADIEIVQTAFERGLITAEQADNIVNKLVDPADEAAEKAAEQLVNRFDSAAQSVSTALQTAIAAGDWEDIGDVIGNTLATTAAGIVSDEISNALADNLTADSGMLAQIGGAFAGPVAGAVVGGVAQLAMSEVADWLSGSDWDPTEARQAAQGTGTVLGDINAKSESIRRAVEGSESGIGQLVGINQSMLRALQTLQLGISGAADIVARQRGGMEFQTSSRYSQAQLAGGVLGIGIGGVTTGSFGPLFGAGSEIYSFVDDALGGILSEGMEFLDDITGGLLSDIGSSVFGGDQKVVDEGIRILGGNLSDLVNRTLVQAYATIKEDGGWFGSDKRFDRFQDIATNQFSLAFESIYDSVLAASDALGIDASGRLGGLAIDTQRISLEGLSAEEQRAEIEAVFSTIFDQAAEAAVPFIEEFQQAGEGLGETLARVANQTMVAQEAVNRLGIQFSDLTGEDLVKASERLMEAAGGVEEFIGSMEGFIDTFASDARQFELAQSDLTRALGQANLQLPATREGYYELLRAQNGATEAGAENIATLLQLRNAADEYYTYLEDAAQAQKELLAEQRAMIQDTLREAERAADALSSALNGLFVTGKSVEQARRAQALDTLRGMVRAGSVTYGESFTSALGAATNISASDYGSMEAYIRDLAATGSVLSDLQEITDEQVAVEEQMLNSLDRQIEATEAGSAMVVAGLSQINQTLGGGQITPTVTASSPTSVASSRAAQSDPQLYREVQMLRSELSTTQKAIARHTSKTAKLLERFELDGIEVRA